MHMAGYTKACMQWHTNWLPANLLLGLFPKQSLKLNHFINIHFPFFGCLGILIIASNVSNCCYHMESNQFWCSMGNSCQPKQTQKKSDKRKLFEMFFSQFECSTFKVYFLCVSSNRDREAAREQANEFLRQGNFNEARKYQQRCVDVTHEMALQLIKRCREMNVDCIVAPYETDAQLAFLNKIGMAEYVVTEDTDLILFGCEKILFKLNISASTGKLVDIGRLHLAMGCAKAIFTMDKFRLMCILSVGFGF